ncbi:MAG: KpsF/GutQ family sugar-phosphate isomerase [Pseudobacteriovorax sp.]|nr:KpsF/GutQ family sugar-phosphate isomerase [Pseudobacteriovorax sp.]
MSDDIVLWGQQALEEEAKSLLAASKNLGEEFSAAVDLILSVTGKVLVSGLGKSGHVGRKIAATLASTGTPSYFFHPAEALHGDLGTIGPSDALLLIAFGGETMETLEVARYARRLSLPIITITGKLDSSLAQLGTINLNGSVVSEVCPLNLAPTSSTTLAMALGDALAVALMKARGFKQEDFAKVHPSGSLGRRLSKVSDHMRTGITSLSPEDPFDRVIEVITSENYGIAAVVDSEGALVGSITDGDLRRALSQRNHEIFEVQASYLMTSSPKTISPQTLAIEAVKMMEQYSVSSLFVTDQSAKIIGLVRMYDLLAAKIV